MPTAAELNDTGAALVNKGDNFAARLHYEAALQEDGRFWRAKANLALSLSDLESLQSSVVLWRQLVFECPQHESLWRHRLGNVLMRLHRYEESMVELNKAAKLAPDDPGVWHNLGLLHNRIGNHQRALESFDKTLRLIPSLLPAQNDRAHVTMALALKNNNLTEALADYEIRWHTLQHQRPWDFHIPEWKGEDLNGKKILFHAEQGFGDAIMLVRFVKDLESIGAEVTCGMPAGLCSLVRSNGLKVLNIDVMSEEDAEGFDFHTPMFSTLRWLGIQASDIDPSPYLMAPKGFSVNTSSHTMNVGICWTSGKRNSSVDWRRRVAKLEDFLCLAEIPNVRLVCLQKGEDEKGITDLSAESLVVNPMNSVKDWEHTAALIASLDMVVSVDTAIVHLSAALGIPTVMLSPFTQCWRWWNIDDKSGLPWYENFVIIPQTDPVLWGDALVEAKRYVEEAARQWFDQKREAA